MFGCGAGVQFFCDMASEMASGLIIEQQEENILGDFNNY
jgi:hypothetical protein